MIIMSKSNAKKIMLLGGIHYLIPVIETAHKNGYYVITADNIPDNIAHKYSDEFVNVSIIDKEAVLKVAQRLEIDGIMSFACDPGVIAASYVQNKMGLPSFGPYESVVILQNKDKFREFLKQNHFNVPWAKGYYDIHEALNDKDKLPLPVIVKPTDSAGSKGVTKVESTEEILPAITYAKNHSISGRFIIEEFIEKEGCSSDSDSISIDGKLRFINFNAQHFDIKASNPFTPAFYSWPSTFTKEQEDYLTSEIQRIIDLLGMKTAVYNIETRIGRNGKPYIMELTPRGGGNRLCEMIKYATGIDLITAITRYTVGDSFDEVNLAPYNDYWAEIILHADKNGIFDNIEIMNNSLFEVIEKDLWIKQGDEVTTFNGANNAIGTLVLKFKKNIEMWRTINHQKDWLKIHVK